jgi:hypothetical protein
MRSAGDQTVDKTIAIEQVWPYDPAKACQLLHATVDTCTTAYGVASGSERYDPVLRAEHANADAHGRYRLSAIEQLHSKPANIAEIAAVLSGGDDVWISFSVNDQAWTSRALQNGVVPDYDVVDDTGHATVLAGYRTLPNGSKQFLIHNSWGTRWGENGFGWISELMVQKNARVAYRVRVVEAALGTPAQAAPSTMPPAGCPTAQVREPVFGTCIPSAIPGLPSGPSPAPPPSDAGPCPPGQAVDLMTGQCSALCPNGGAAVGGLCIPFAP